MDLPSITIAGEFAVCNECEPRTNCDDCDATKIKYGIAVSFPDAESVREALRTGKIGQCTVFGKVPE